MANTPVMTNAKLRTHDTSRGPVVFFDVEFSLQSPPFQNRVLTRRYALGRDANGNTSFSSPDLDHLRAILGQHYRSLPWRLPGPALRVQIALKIAEGTQDVVYHDLQVIGKQDPA